MTVRFSSREAAREAVQKSLQAERAAYSPKGASWDSPEKAFSIIAKPTKIWTYRTPDSPQGTMRLFFDSKIAHPYYTVLAEHNGKWYLDFPKPPYLLYQRYGWGDAETVYVCDEEAVADLVESVGLAASATLGGLGLADRTDWSPLRGKHVVILPNLDQDGARHAAAAAQLSLSAGALSARVLTPRDRKPNDKLETWVSERIRQFGREATKRCLVKLAEAASPVVYVKPPEKPPKGPRVDLQSLADIDSEPLEWIFDRIIPSGRLTVLTGAPGVGKSFMLLELVARVTRGLRSPYEQPREALVAEKTEDVNPISPPADDNKSVPPISGDVRNGPGNVILISSTGELSNTIRPRLSGLGADLSRVYALRGVSEVDGETGTPMTWSFQLDRDLALVEAELERLDKKGISVQMIAIDPIDRYLVNEDRRSQPDADVLALRLSEFAEQTGVAVVIVTQTTQRGQGAINRLGPPSRRQRFAASGAFPAAAQSVWMVASDGDDPKSRLLLPVKTNLCERGPGLAYSVRDGRILWKPEAVELTADEALQSKAERTRQSNQAEDRSELTRATEWLKERLNEKPVHSVMVIEDARANLISERTLRRAKSRLGVHSKRQAGTGQSHWSLEGDGSVHGVDPTQSPLQEGPRNPRQQRVPQLGPFGERLSRPATDDRGVTDDSQEMHYSDPSLQNTQGVFWDEYARGQTHER